MPYFSDYEKVHELWLATCEAMENYETRTRELKGSYRSVDEATKVAWANTLRSLATYLESYHS